MLVMDSCGVVAALCHLDYIMLLQRQADDALTTHAENMTRYLDEDGSLEWSESMVVVFWGAHLQL